MGGYNYMLFTHAGIKFWKVGSRKLYAVIVKGEGKKRKRKYSDSDASGGEEKVRIEVCSRLITIERKLTKILDITPNLPMPLGLLTLLHETFKCSICKSSIIIVPPVIYGRCCKRIIGCQRCTDTWYRGDDGLMRSCPLCRSERAFADTTQILGIDELLTRIDELTRMVPPPPGSIPVISDSD